jgi:hypothetical protein
MYISKTKEQLLNDVIGMTKRTGQGLPQFVIDRGGWQHIADELVEEGHLAIYGRNTNDPVTTWYCYTKCYNVEKDTSNLGTTMAYYAFMRHYLRIAEEDRGVLHSNSEVVNANMDLYKEFLMKNLEGLEAIKSLEEVSIGTELLDDQIEYLKDREWYKKNLTIEECLEDMKEGNETIEEIIPQTEKIIKMMGNDPKYAEDVEKYKISVEESKIELKTRKKLYSIMDGEDSDIKIQELFSKYTEKV